ncbi:MAG: TRAP transporter small permease [Candidatus Odyssella sp.]|nr:TRAP transporter small permease [Candidatus Odyssella sp.]
MPALAKGLGRVLDLCGAVAALLVLAMTALIVADVALRNLFNFTLPASVELTEYAMFFASAFAAPWLLRRGQHIRVDIVVVRAPPRVGWIMEIACDLIGLALSLLMTWYGFAMVLRSWRGGTLVVKNLVFEEWYILWPLPVMFLLLAVEFVFRLRRVLAGPRQARREGGSV